MSACESAGAATGAPALGAALAQGASSFVASGAPEASHGAAPAQAVGPGAAAVAAVERERQVLGALLAWCASRGVRDVSVRPAEFPESGGRGLAAVRALAPGDVLVAVPEDALMSGASAARDAGCAAAMRAAADAAGGRALQPEERLALHVLCELAKGTTSAWAPYLRSLPARYDTLAHFSADCAAELQASWAVSLARAEARRVGLSATRARPAREHARAALPERLQSLSAWRWALATVGSRAVYVPFDAAGALCPLGDLHNYAPPLRAGEVELQQGGTQHFGEGSGDAVFEEGHLVWRARRYYREGEEALVCYGRYTNLQLLELYGFVLRDNPHDTYQLGELSLRALRLRLPEAHTPLGRVVAELRTEDARLSVDTDGRPSWELMALLRAAFYDDKDDASANVRAAHSATARRGPAEQRWSEGRVEKSGHAAAERLRAGEPLSDASEARSSRWLAMAVRSELRAVPTSASEDEALLVGEAGRGSDGCLGDRASADRVRLAIQWRLGWKRALEATERRAFAVAASA